MRGDLNLYTKNKSLDIIFVGAIKYADVHSLPRDQLALADID